MLQCAVADGSLCLFEASALAKGTSLGFSTACQIGQKACKDLTDFYIVLDVFACREQGILPLDNRVIYDDGIHFEKPGLSDDDDVFFNDTAIEEANPAPFNQRLRDLRRYLSDLSPYNPLISLPEDARVRIVPSETDRFFEALLPEGECPLFSTEQAPFAYRLDETQAAIQLDAMEKRASASGSADGEVCLCFGLLRWSLKDATGEAPLLVLPLRLFRRRGRLSGFSSMMLKPRLNTALLAFLSEYFALDFPGLREIGDASIEGFVKKLSLFMRSELTGNPNLSIDDQEIFFALLKTSSNDQLNGLNAARLEAHPLAKAVCSGEVLESEPSPAPTVVDIAPVSVPIPYSLDREAHAVVAAAQKQDYTLVSSPACGGKTRLGTALAFSALNHSEQTVLYISGEHANARDTLEMFSKAGIDDLAGVLSTVSPFEANFTMRETQMFPSEEYYTLSSEYSDDLKKLLCYESILAEKLSCGVTPEDAIYCFDHVRKAADCLHFSPESVGKMDEKTVATHQQVIRSLASTLSSIGSPVGHPLRYVCARGFSYEIKAEAVRLLDEYTKKFKEYVTFLRGSCAGMFPHAKIHNQQHEKAFLNLLNMIGSSRGVNACYFEREIAASDLAKAETIFAYGKECCEMRSGVLSNLTPVAFDLPVKEMIISWRDAELKRGGVRKKIQREITQKLSACCQDPKDVNVLETLYQIEKYLNYRAYLFENAALIQRLFGVDILAPQNDTAEIWMRLAELCRDCVTVDRQLSALAGESRVDAANLMRNFTEEDASRAASLGEGILELRAEMEKIRDRFLRYLEIDDKSFREEYRDTLYDEIPKFLKELAGGMDSLQQWTEWLNAADVARATGFAQVLDAVDAGHLTGETLEDAYARAFFMALCEYVFLKYPVLCELRGASFDEKLAELSEKRGRIYEFARQDIRGKHLRRYTNFLQESGLDPDKRAALTPAFFAASPYALTCRYPVLIANAQDAVRFLEGTPARFGVLIFDDAQTLTMPSALALLPRAEKVIVLGTGDGRGDLGKLSESTDRFIKRKRENIASFWSVISAVLPCEKLDFARQKAIGLLDVATAALGLADRALPFVTQSTGIRAIRTPGQYDPLTFINLPEVMQTVDEILKIFRRHLEENKPLSLGVCATTRTQKQLILQTLAKRLREEPALYAVLQNAREPFYVSSLSEEPLGRRDIVLWSMTIGPTKSLNAPSRAFPLLSDPNGSRRIASVLTAARNQLCVLHSIHADSLDLMRITTDAHATFRRICKLIFDHSTEVSSIVDSSASYDNPIAARIADYLREKGCRVFEFVRSGSFGIDLVARLPHDASFTLAVLLDESVYSVCSGHVLGEVDLMEQLAGRGFTPIHVRATDWFENDLAVLESIAALLPQKRK